MENEIAVALRQIKDSLSDPANDPSPQSVTNLDDRKEDRQLQVKTEPISNDVDLSSAASQSGDQSQAPEEIVSHQDAMQSAQEAMADLIKNDPLLSDLPTEVTLEEINSCIALEYGQAMVVNVRRADDEIMAVVVTQNATVLDLKHAIKRHVTLKHKRTGGKPHISWRYVWRRHWLYYEGQKLTQDNKPLKEYGVRNKDEVTFMKRLKEK